MFRNYKQMIEDGMPDVSGLFRLPKHVASTPDKGGVNIKFVPYAEMERLFGDYVGWRKDGEIYLATDYKGRKLTPAEMEAHFLHEYFSGHDHKRTDEEAQALALEYAGARAQMDRSYTPVVDTIKVETERLFGRN